MAKATTKKKGRRSATVSGAYTPKVCINLIEPRPDGADSRIDSAKRRLNGVECSILRRIHYPKLTLLVLVFILSYVLIYGKPSPELHAFIISLGYLGVFAAGFFYAYGFTAAPATLVLLSIAKDESLVWASLAGGLGALIGDIAMFLFIKHTFDDELLRLSKTNFVRKLGGEEARLFGRFKKYVKTTFASFIIASPLPTEIGVAMFASIRELSAKKFLVIAYALHTTGIFIILLVGNLL